MATRLETIIIEPDVPADSCIIWLHGLGATADDLVPVAKQLIFDNKALRFIFPQAPSRPITLNQGYYMPGWYDVLGINRTSIQDEVGIKTSENLLIEIIENQISSGIAANKIILAGFSQGGVMALHTALRYPVPLGGILVLSGYLAVDYLLAKEKNKANLTIPIFWGHGALDPIVTLTLANEGIKILQDEGYNLELHTYPIEHTISWNEICDIKAWLEKVL